MPKKIRKNLFEYLRHLDEKEDFPKIKKYLESPFFGVESRKKVIKLFELLIQHPRFYIDKPAIKNSSLNKKMGITDVGNIKSNLVKCIEDYLRIGRVEKIEHWKILLLAESLDKLNMHKQHEKYVDYELDLQSNKNNLTEEDYYLKYKLLIGKHKSSVIKEKVNQNVLEESINTLNYYYLYANLINLITHKTLVKVVKRKTDVSRSIDMIMSMKEIDYVSDPNILISFFIFKSLITQKLDKKVEIYYKIKKIVSQNWENFAISYRYEIYINMINIVSDIILYKIGSFENEINEIHQFWIDKNVLQVYDELDKTLFISIIKAAYNSNRFDWANNFILKKKNMLVEQERQPTLQLCDAFMNFRLKNFSETIRILSCVEKLDPLFKLYTRILVLKCWYELKDDYQFESSFSNIDIFIYREKRLSDEMKEQFKITIKWIRKIQKARLRHSLDKLLIYKKKLQIKFILKERMWITKKVEELILLFRN